MFYVTLHYIIFYRYPTCHRILTNFIILSAVSSTPHHGQELNSQVVKDAGFINRCKSNYHTIMIEKAPFIINYLDAPLDV